MLWNTIKKFWIDINEAIADLIRLNEEEEDNDLRVEV